MSSQGIRQHRAKRLKNPNLRGGRGGEQQLIPRKKPVEKMLPDRVLIVARLFKHTVPKQFVLHIIEDLRGKEVWSKEIVAPKDGLFKTALTIAEAKLEIDPRVTKWVFNKDEALGTIAEII